MVKLMQRTTHANRRIHTEKPAWLEMVRRTVEYALTVGAAVLCGYWIVRGRW
jgi:hypothetical protein